MGILHLIESVAVIFILMGVGFILKKKGIVRERDTKILSDIIITVAVPALVFHSIIETFTKKMLLSSYTIIVFSIFMSIIALLVAIVTVKGLKSVKGDKSDIFLFTCILPNTVFIGLPIILSLYGNQSAGLVFIFDIGSFIILWTIGIYLVNRKETFAIKEMIKEIVNVPFIVFIISTVLILIEAPRPPYLIMEVADMLGSIAIPLSMLLIGMNIANLKFNYKKVDYSIALIALIRLIIVPVIMIFILLHINIPILFKKVIIIEAGLPTMLTTAILARKYNKGYQYATTAVFVTTLIGLLTIPLIAYLSELLLGT